MSRAECPGCRARLRLEAARFGRSARCPGCGAELRCAPDGFFLVQPGCSVIRTDDEKVDPARIRDAIVEVLRWHSIDAMQAARDATPYAVLAEELDSGLADRFARALERAGASARIVPTADVPRLPRARVIQRLRWEPPRLVLADHLDRPIAEIPGETVRLLCAGEVSQPQQSEIERVKGFGRLDETPGASRVARPLHVEYGARTVRPGPVEECWIVADPPTQAWRIHRGVIAEGLELTESSEPPTFREVLLALRQALPREKVCDCFASFLRDRKPGTHRFETTEDFLHYTRRQWIRTVLATD